MAAGRHLHCSELRASRTFALETQPLCPQGLTDKSQTFREMCCRSAETGRSQPVFVIAEALHVLVQIFWPTTGDFVQLVQAVQKCWRQVSAITTFKADIHRSWLRWAQSEIAELYSHGHLQLRSRVVSRTSAQLEG